MKVNFIITRGESFMNYAQKTLSLVLLCTSMMTAQISHASANTHEYIRPAGYAAGMIMTGMVAHKLEDYCESRSNAQSGLKKLAIRALTLSSGSALYALCKWIRTGKLDIGLSALENQIIKLVLMYAIDEAQEYTGILTPMSCLPGIGDVLSVGDYSITKFIVAQLIVDVLGEKGYTLSGREQALKAAKQANLEERAVAFDEPIKRALHKYIGNPVRTLLTKSNSARLWLSNHASKMITRKAA
jgi:hypothetical protein